MAEMSSSDKLRFLLLGIAGSVFTMSVIVQFFKPSQEINTAANVFMVIAGLVLGGSVANNFINPKKE